MPVTESRILDLLAEACKRERTPGSGGYSWTFMFMSSEERLAFDVFLVRTGDPLAFEPGTTEKRFRERVRRMVAPFKCTACGEPYPCSDSKRTDILPAIRAQHVRGS